MGIGNKHFDALTNNVEQYKDTVLQLSARLKADSFFYGIFDKNNQMLVSGELQLKDNFDWKAIESYNYKFKHVNIAIDNNSYTQILDTDISNSSNHSLFFKNLKNNVHQGLYNHDKLRFDHIVNLYPLDIPRLDTVMAKFPDAKISHFSSCLINFASTYLEDSVHAYISEDLLYITAVESSRLLVYNQYEVHSSEDYLYYISMIYQELNLDKNIVPLIVSGDIYPASKVYSLIKGYFRNIEFPMMSRFSVAQIHRDVLSSHYYDQYISAQCV